MGCRPGLLHNFPSNSTYYVLSYNLRQKKKKKKKKNEDACAFVSVALRQRLTEDTSIFFPCWRARAQPSGNPTAGAANLLAMLERTHVVQVVIGDRCPVTVELRIHLDHAEVDEVVLDGSFLDAVLPIDHGEQREMRIAN